MGQTRPSTRHHNLRKKKRARPLPKKTDITPEELLGKTPPPTGSERANSERAKLRKLIDERHRGKTTKLL